MKHQSDGTRNDWGRHRSPVQIHLFAIWKLTYSGIEPWILCNQQIVICFGGYHLITRRNQIRLKEVVVVVLDVDVATQLAQMVVGMQPPCAPPKHCDDAAEEAQELPAGVEKELGESFGMPVTVGVAVAVGPVGVMVTGPVGMVVSLVTSTMST